jgi:transposase
MDIHKNARLTLRRREDLVQHVACGVTLKLAAANFKVTPKTVAKWVRRFRRQGPPGLFDRSSRPRRNPRQTSSSLAEEVVALRRLLLSRLSHRPGDPTQCRHGQPHPAARSS